MLRRSSNRSACTCTRLLTLETQQDLMVVEERASKVARLELVVASETLSECLVSNLDELLLSCLEHHVE